MHLCRSGMTLRGSAPRRRYRKVYRRFVSVVSVFISIRKMGTHPAIRHSANNGNLYTRNSQLTEPENNTGTGGTVPCSKKCSGEIIECSMTLQGLPPAHEAPRLRSHRLTRLQKWRDFFTVHTGPSYAPPPLMRAGLARGG
jgi:hypothetical protein